MKHYHSTTVLLAAALLMLPACSLVDAMRRTAQSTADLVEQGRDTLASAQGLAKDAKAEYHNAKSAADTDGDGKTSALEWAAYLLGGLGAAKVALTTVTRNTKSDGRKDIIERRLDALETPRA